MARGIRVIAGTARGRRLMVPLGDDVRPTKDMVREAMFSALDARGRLVDATVLDLYAGTGALGIEALSRGAAHAVFVESDRSAAAAIRANLRSLSFVDSTRLHHGSVERFVGAELPPEAPFDLVLIDPPYAVDDAELEQLYGALLAPGWLTADALISVERSARARVAPPASLRTEWERTFGDTLVVFLTADEH